MLSSKSLIQSTILGSIAAAIECEYDGNIPVVSKAVTERIYKIKAKLILKFKLIIMKTLILGMGVQGKKEKSSAKVIS